MLALITAIPNKVCYCFRLGYGLSVPVLQPFVAGLSYLTLASKSCIS